MPTSWQAYQTLLVLPLMIGLALAPRPALDSLTWVLMLYMGAAGAISFGACTPPIAAIRSLISLAGWWVCGRLLGQTQVASVASSVAPSSRRIRWPASRDPLFDMVASPIPRPERTSKGDFAFPDQHEIDRLVAHGLG